MAKTELEELPSAQKTCSDYERTLFRYEIASMTLYSLAHIKDLRAMIETLTGAHASMNVWGSTSDACKKIVDNLYTNGAIVAHGVSDARQEEATYCPSDAAPAENKMKKIIDRIGRGIGEKNAIKHAQELTF